MPPRRPLPPRSEQRSAQRGRGYLAVTSPHVVSHFSLAADQAAASLTVEPDRRASQAGSVSPRPAGGCPARRSAVPKVTARPCRRHTGLRSWPAGSARDNRPAFKALLGRPPAPCLCRRPDLCGVPGWRRRGARPLPRCPDFCPPACVSRDPDMGSLPDPALIMLGCMCYIKYRINWNLFCWRPGRGRAEAQASGESHEEADMKASRRWSQGYSCCWAAV